MSCQPQEHILSNETEDSSRRGERAADGQGNVSALEHISVEHRRVGGGSESQDEYDRF